MSERFPRRVHTLPDPEAVAESAAQWTQASLGAALADRGRAALALSGGATPARLFRRLATPPFSAWPHWPEVEVFWVDERALPAHSAESNYRLAEVNLLSRLPDPPRRVHRLRGESVDLESEAKRYAALLDPWREDGVPRLDVLLLGMGLDGHVASLFPGSAAGGRMDAWVLPAAGPPPHTQRLTLTRPVLDAARHAAFLVTGAEKHDTLKRVLSAAEESGLPAANVRSRAMTDWFVDVAAAQALRQDA